MTSTAFEQRGLTLADADAQRRQPVAAAAASKFVKERDDEPGAAHAERMTDRDRAAVHVHSLCIEPELADTTRLRGEGLVQLDQVDLADATPARSSSLRTAGTGPIPITRGRPRRRRGDERPERLGAELACALLAGDHERGGTVVDPARVARRHRAAFAEGGLEGGELLRRSVGPRMLVARRRRPGRARRRSALPRPPPPSAAATAARTRPGPRATRPTARRRSRLSRPSTPVGTSPPAADSGSASRASCPTRSGRRAGTPVRLRQHERRPRHRLDAAGDEEVAVTGRDGMAAPTMRTAPTRRAG